MTAGPSKTAIACHEWCLEHLGKRDVRGIVNREVLAELPDPFQQSGMRISVQREVRQVGECLGCSIRLRLTAQQGSAESLGDLEIHHVGNVQGLTVPEQPVDEDFHVIRSAQQIL